MNAASLRVIACCLMMCWAATAAIGNPGAAVVMPILFMASFGNGLISLVEIVVAKIMGARWRSLLLISMGNYFSMWFGLISSFIIFDWIWSFWEDPLIGAVPATWIATSVLVTLGFVLEFPFFLLSFDLKPTTNGHPARWRRALVTTILAGAVSNVVVAAGIHMSWNHSLLLNFSYPSDPSIMADAAMLDGTKPWVYAITNDGSTIERFRLDGSDRAVVFTFDPPLQTDHLIQAMERDAGFSLVLTKRSYSDAELPDTDSIDPQPSVADYFSTGEEYYDDHWIELVSNVGRLATVGRPDQILPDGEWDTADLSTDAGVGYEVFGWETTLTIRHPHRGQTTLALQNGFIKNAASIGHARLLPDNVLVLALGQYDDGEPSLGIYAASLYSWQLVRISADGRSPVVIYE